MRHRLAAPEAELVIPMTQRFLLASLLLLFGNAGAAVIVTYRSEAPNLFNLEFPYLTDTHFDINADGISDFRFIGGHFVAALQAFGTNQFISMLSTGSDLGGELVSISAGSIIGGNTVSLPGDWHHHTDNRGASGFNLSTVQYADGYLGVSFQAADGIHYGWIKYTGLGVAKFGSYDEDGNLIGYTEGLNIPGGLIDSWAFESEPGKAIVAGVVPEPAASLLAEIGFATVLLRRKRNS